MERTARILFRSARINGSAFPVAIQVRDEAPNRQGSTSPSMNSRTSVTVVCDPADASSHARRDSLLTCAATLGNAELPFCSRLGESGPSTRETRTGAPGERLETEAR
jgi:hypothetical protein